MKTYQIRNYALKSKDLIWDAPPQKVLTIDFLP